MTDPRSAEIENHRPYLLRYALAHLRDGELAQEAVQEALLAALESVGSFSGKSTLRTWLASILRYKVIDLQRRAVTERSHLVHDEDDAQGDEACLAGLPSAAARVFFKREVLGEETEVICNDERITASNCWVILHRARVSLRGCLERNWFATQAAGGR